MTIALLLSTFNGEKFLSEQLSSLASQTHQDWVLYWRDDSSTDRTPRIMRAFAAGRPAGQVIAVPDLGRYGATESFLRLLRHAAMGEHEAIAFVDQDDVWLPEKLARAVTRLEKVERGIPALYFSRQVLVDPAGRRLRLSPPVRRPPGFPAALIQNLATGCTVAMNQSAARLVTRSTAPAAAFHDWWCFVVVAAAGGRLVADPAATVLYRQHPANAWVLRSVGPPGCSRHAGAAPVRSCPCSASMSWRCAPNPIC